MIKQGLGCNNAIINFYIANTPAMPEYQDLQQILPLVPGEINSIGKQLGNGWRKVFNVYAKFLFQLDKQHYPFQQASPSWQEYRDNHLLQAKSGTALLFSPPDLSCPGVHIITGRGYAKHLVQEQQLEVPLTWLNEEFAVNHDARLYVCPYLDYRQLSNIKIEYLVNLIAQSHAS